MSILGCGCAVRIGTTRAQFAHFPGECIEPETRWRMMQSDANCSLRLNSLIIRENTGNFRDFGRSEPKSGQKTLSSLEFLPKFPTRWIREF
jgi:hypothetical protein